MQWTPSCPVWRSSSICGFTKGLIPIADFLTAEDIPRLISPDTLSTNSVEISPSTVKQAVEYFDIICNTSPGFVVELRSGAVESWALQRPWQLLASVWSIIWNNTIYTKGDIVYIRTGAQRTAVEIFEIADIRNLGDSRSVLRGFWYYSRLDLARNLRSTDLRGWPKRHPYTKSTHTDIIMWDCATGHLCDDDKERILPTKICNMSGGTWSIESQSSASVAWALTK